MANYSDSTVKTQQKIKITVSMDKEIKLEPKYAENYCVESFMESDCVLGVDAVEREVLIDGRDLQNEESGVAGSIIYAEHSEDERERIDVGIPLIPKKNINMEKRKRHKPFIKEGAKFKDHHYTGKKKRRKYGEEIRTSHLTIEDAKTDSKNNRFKCAICDRTFCYKAFLNRHLIIHTGEKPYECEICHRRFNREVNLNTHLIIHTGEKPFQCDICNVEFSLKGNLNRHLKTHTGEKPFRCDVCNFACSQKVNLQTHVQRHFQTHNLLEKLNDDDELRDDMIIYMRNGDIYVAKLY